MINLKMSEEELRELRDTLKAEISRYEVLFSQEVSARAGKIELINELLGEVPEEAVEGAVNNGKVKEEVVAA